MSSAVSGVKEGAENDLLEFDFSGFKYTPLGRFIVFRLANNYDAKIVITGDVGDGKTALGVSLGRWTRKVANGIFDKFHPWDVERHAGLDVWKYLEAYKESNPGDALVIDELQEAADRRRSQSNENVFLSWAWMKLRVRQVVSIGILPTTSALDKRLLELADVRIHVVKRGLAYPYYLNTTPFEPYKTYHNHFRHGDFIQSIKWADLAGDPDYERLHEMKTDSGVPGIDENEHLSENDLKEALREEKRKRVEQALPELENGGIRIESQADLAEFVGIDQSTVSKYKRQLQNGDDL